MRIVIETNDLSRQEAVALISFFATLANQVDAILPAITPESIDEATAASKRTPDEAFGAPRTADEAFGVLPAQDDTPSDLDYDPLKDPAYIAQVGAQPPTHIAAQDVDSAGVAWDPTIHATSEKTGGGVKKADGTWRARAKRGGAAATYQPPVTVGAPDIVAPPPPTVAAPAAPTPPPAPPAPPAQSDFVTFMQKMQARSKTDATVTPRAVQWAINHGTTLPGLTSRPDLIAAITAEFGL